MTVGEIVRLLAQEYGVPRWEPSDDPMGVLIGTVLSQNTSDVNSHRAFETLRHAFDTWQRLADADPEDIASAIRLGGLNRIKAQRIKAILRAVLEKRGSLDLGFLRELPVPEARAWLERLPGVGPKTAACVLLFGLRMPALPVDTHVLRVSKRLGLLDSRVSPEQAHGLLQEIVPAGDVHQFHVNILAHGRKVCRARRPLCTECVLAPGCPSYRIVPERAGCGEQVYV